MRETEFIRDYTMHAEGSVLTSFGNTRVLCTAMVDEKVPPYREASGLGWLSGEYNMLPSSTLNRKRRPGVKPDGRGTEISRLIGRSLRAALDFEKLGPRTIWIDCEVLQADGGTRTTAITGGFIALYDAVLKLMEKGLVDKNPIKHFIAAVSVGYVAGELVIDLDYKNDSKAEVDLNVVGTGGGDLIEVQGTAENGVFSRDQMTEMLDGAQKTISELVEKQKQILGL